MNLEARIKQQFPALMITLLSVLIGLDFSDLVSLAREHLMLWPLDSATLRTWGQILTMIGCCFSVWVIFAHTGVSRLRVPALADSMIVFLMPLSIIIGNSFVGQNAGWPWFCWASAYLLTGVVTWRWQIHIALEENALVSFSRLTHPLRAMFFLYFGVPFYAAAAWADYHQLLPPNVEGLVALSGFPAAMVTTWMFVGEWCSAIAAAEMRGA